MNRLEKRNAEVTNLEATLLKISYTGTYDVPRLQEKLEDVRGIIKTIEQLKAVRYTIVSIKETSSIPAEIIIGTCTQKGTACVYVKSCFLTELSKNIKVRVKKGEEVAKKQIDILLNMSVDEQLELILISLNEIKSETEASINYWLDDIE